MAAEHAYRIEDELHRLTEIERRVLARFIHRQKTARTPLDRNVSLGDRLADRVAAFGGSWTFILLCVVSIAAWMTFNALNKAPFDAYPYIFLNLVLSCIAALQAPIIMMSQNRQAAHDRADMVHDYEINTKAELEIVALHTKLDEIREQKWVDLLKLQEQQLEILTQLAAGKSR